MHTTVHTWIGVWIQPIFFEYFLLEYLLNKEGDPAEHCPGSHQVFKIKVGINSEKSTDYSAYLMRDQVLGPSENE